MTPEQHTQLVSALKSTAGSLSFVGFAIIMAGLWNMCGAMGHH